MKKGELEKETSLNKEGRFRASYWGQDVRVYKRTDDPIQFRVKVGQSIPDNQTSIEYDYLLLTPLSSITDEQAIEVARLSDEYDYTDILDSEFEVFKNAFEHVVVGVVGQSSATVVLREDLLNADQIDKSREFGIAVRYSGTSVEKQIELGWTKLK